MGERLVDYLDKGASLGADARCLTTNGESLSYREVQDLSSRIAGALAARGVAPGDKVAIISGNDPIAFTCVFGISRAGAVWCPINPRNEAAENRELLDLFDATLVIFGSPFADLVRTIQPHLDKVHTWVCLDAEVDGALSWDDFLAGQDHLPGSDSEVDASPVRDLALIVGTGGTTGRPKGVMLTGANIETMTAITLMSYPFGARPGATDSPEHVEQAKAARDRFSSSRPVYLALAPLTHAAGVLCFPILALGGEIVIMPAPDVGGFLELIAAHRVTHTFLPPTLIYMVLGHPALDATDLSSLQCFWYGAAPMSVARLAEALTRIGPVMAQLFGQTEAPMMISTMAPADHFHADGSVATERLGSAGRPSPLCTVAILDDEGRSLPRGERGEIVVRGSLVMPGYYKNPQATAEASAHGWHHTGDIGYLDDDNYLFIVDRAKDMIISGGFNVYSTEVEQALLAHPDIQDCAVIGLPDEKWGERVVAVVQPTTGATPDPGDVARFVKERIGSVKTPKQVEVWADLPRSKVGKVLKTEIKATLRADPQ
ncbi:MAG: acyl-CoA synthetase [Actinomycetales bacterium]